MAHPTWRPTKNIMDIGTRVAVRAVTRRAEHVDMVRRGAIQRRVPRTVLKMYLGKLLDLACRLKLPRHPLLLLHR